MSSSSSPLSLSLSLSLSQTRYHPQSFRPKRFRLAGWIRRIATRLGASASQDGYVPDEDHDSKGSRETECGDESEEGDEGNESDAINNEDYYDEG